jgi:hypothetical protein
MSTQNTTRTPAGKAADGATVGSYVNALCGKCKSMTSHIVLAKIGGRPTRVECRTCHAMHAYRSGEPKPRSSGSGTTRSTARAPKVSPEEIWAAIMRQGRGEVQPYSTGGRYAVGARLRHPSFGEGVVARLSSTTVCEVVFATGTVKLIMGAAPSERQLRS